MTHKARVHMHHCNQGEYVGTCKYGQDDRCPALKDSFNQEYKEDLEALGIDINTHDWKQVFKFFKVVKKEPEEKCPALKKYPPKDPKKLTDPEMERALAECHLQCEISEQGKAALAWMRAQAKALDPSVKDDWGPFFLARVISSYIVPKKVRRKL